MNTAGLSTGNNKALESGISNQDHEISNPPDATQESANSRQTHYLR